MTGGKYFLRRPTLMEAAPFPTPRRGRWGTEAVLIPARTFDSWLLEVNEPLTFGHPIDIEPRAADTKIERTASPCVTAWKAGERSRTRVGRSHWHTPCNGFFTEM